MKIENIEVFGFRRAFHGMRNPQDSWDKSDSEFYKPSLCFQATVAPDVLMPEFPSIGSADMELACNLIKRGSEHRKFLRQIMVWMDITIPRYVWQELDTYKVATVRNSCSTMNKLGSRDLEQCDFEMPILELTLEHINMLGRLLREAKEESKGVRQARRQLKNELSEGFLQKATYLMSYETALSAILQREPHRLPEWRLENTKDTPEGGSITQNLMRLPYMKQFYGAATWKRDEIRALVKELDDIAACSREHSHQITAWQIEKIRDRLKKVAA